MNAITGRFVRADVSAESLSPDGAHIWRSKIIEKCAEAERYVLNLLQARGKTCPAKAPLSQKIEALKKAVNGGTKTDAKLLTLLEELRPYSDLRSDLVHATVSIAVIEEGQVAVVRSAAELDDGAGERRLMTQACFKAAYEGTSRVVNSLKQAARAH